MNTKIDIKSALCGLGIGVLTMIAIGAGTSQSAIGRYQVGLTGNPAYAMVIDTSTGQVWSRLFGNTGQFQNDGDFFQPKQK